MRKPTRGAKAIAAAAAASGATLIVWLVVGVRTGFAKIGLGLTNKMQVPGAVGIWKVDDFQSKTLFGWETYVKDLIFTCRGNFNFYYTCVATFDIMDFSEFVDVTS
ncbi:hypothetical protein RUM44_005384 [Polyplax serrata]|uniref:Uncharacterized protein n=1 Tax=Polyplax serrata TaxID=468196 RepID=A0ABR1ADU8_POLSC